MDKETEREVKRDWKRIVRESGGFPPKLWRIVLEDVYPANWGEKEIRRSLKSSGSCVTAKIIKLSLKRRKEQHQKNGKKPPRRGRKTL